MQDVALRFKENCAACHGEDGTGNVIRKVLPLIPDFTSLAWQAAQTGRYRLLQLKQRPAGITLPTVEIVDLRDAYRQLRRKVILTPMLMQALSDVLAKGEQALLLLNRRGYENFWMCRACGKTSAFSAIAPPCRKSTA